MDPATDKGLDADLARKAGVRTEQVIGREGKAIRGGNVQEDGRDVVFAPACVGCGDRCRSRWWRRRSR